MGEPSPILGVYRKAAEPNREPGTGTVGTEPIQNRNESEPNRVRTVENRTGKGSKALKPNQRSESMVCVSEEGLRGQGLCTYMYIYIYTIKTLYKKTIFRR